MTLPKDLTKRYSKVKERGDGKKLMKLLHFRSHSNVSAILSGDRATTISKIEKIKRFIEDREKIIATINDDDLN